MKFNIPDLEKLKEQMKKYETRSVNVYAALPPAYGVSSPIKNEVSGIDIPNMGLKTKYYMNTLKKKEIEKIEIEEKSIFDEF